MVIALLRVHTVRQPNENKIATKLQISERTCLIERLLRAVTANMGVMTAPHLWTFIKTVLQGINS